MTGQVSDMDERPQLSWCALIYNFVCEHGHLLLNCGFSLLEFRRLLKTHLFT